ncbi:MAG: dihydrofolate reductase family protein, partial [Anaerolineae bacterium]|nr:dihydrofolate reductase family protein [Anaerolineae bacterium]
IQGDVAAELAKIKALSGKDISIVGSGVLTRTLIEMNLVDELQLMLCPVVLGQGKKLFDDTDYTKKMDVVEVRTFDSGMIYLRLKPKAQD